ncbi:MAG TPA: translocation/assembly module TamB domain-containing protein [Burkholderiales bacterium]|nr:translocation/assembly module TamB domain-containing protein [Burkholderiales bacterium]
MTRLGLRLLLVLVLAALAALAGGGAWLLGTQQGLAWALARAAQASGGKLVVEQPQGTLGGGLTLARLRWAEGAARVEARAVRLRVSPLSLVLLRPDLARLECGELELVLPEGAGSAALPESLALPLRVHVARLHVGTLRVVRGAQAFTLRDLRLAYGYGHGLHRVERLHLVLQGVTLEGRAALGAAPPFAASGALELAGAYAGVPYAAELGISGDLRELGLELSGRAKGARAQGRAVLRPLEGLPPQSLSLRVRELDLHAFDAELPRTQLALSASLERRGDALAGPLAVELGAGDVAGSVTVDASLGFAARLRFARVDLSRLGDLPASALSGEATLAGALRGERHLRLEFKLAPSELAGRPLSGGGQVRIVGEGIAESSLALGYSGASLDARGAFGRPDDRLKLRIKAPDLAALMPDVRGRATLDGTLYGGWRRPAASFTAEASDIALGSQLDAQELRLRAQLAADARQPLHVVAEADGVGARGLRAERVRVRVDGTRTRHAIELAAQGKALDFSARLEGVLRGTSDWRGTLVSARNRGALPFELEAPAALSVAPRRFALESLDLRFEHGRVRVAELRWEDGRLASTGELSDVAVVPLLRLAGSAVPLEGGLTLGAQWSVTAAPLPSGTFKLWREGGDLTVGSAPPLELGLSALDISGELAAGRLEAKGSFAARSGRGEVTLRLEPGTGGAAFLYAADSRLDARLDAQLASLAPVGALIDRSARIGGRLVATLEVRGTLAQPAWSGSIEGEGLSYARPPDGIYLTDGRLRARLDGERIQLTELTIASAGGGSFAAQGTLARGESERATITWRADKLALLERPDQRLVLSGQGAAVMAGRRLSFSGSLRADSGFFSFDTSALPRLGEDVVVVGRAPSERKEQRIGRKENPSPVDVDLQLDLGRDLRIQGRGIDAGLAGKVHVHTNEAGVLIAEGTVRAVHGTVTAYGTRLAIERGRLIFDGPLNKPSLDILAMRRNQEVEAGVAVSGTLQNPVVRIVSEPQVPEGEALSWLVLGRAPGAGSGADLTMLQTAAGALIGRGPAGAERSLAQTLGVDSISVGGGGDLGGRFVTVGKRVNDRAMVLFEQGLGGTASVLRLDFELSRLWSLSASTGQQSDVGLRFRYSFD